MRRIICRSGSLILAFIALIQVARPAEGQDGSASPSNSLVPTEVPNEDFSIEDNSANFTLTNATTQAASTEAPNEIISTNFSSKNVSTGAPTLLETLSPETEEHKETNYTLAGQSAELPVFNTTTAEQNDTLTLAEQSTESQAFINATRAYASDIYGTFLFINGTEIDLTNYTNISDRATVGNLEGAIYNATEINVSTAFSNYYCPKETFALMPSDTDSSRQLIATIVVFTPIYIIGLCIFCICRKRYPRYFNVRSWVPEMKCDIALKEYKGYVSWIWEVYLVSDDEILDQCGMDSLCFIRALRLSTKLSAFACFHSIYLIPLYATGPSTEYISDPFAIMTAGNLPNDSPIFLATVLATYFITFYATYLFLKEFEWYTEYRHKLLVQRVPRNYAVYVSGIPEEFQTSFALGQYFEESTQGLCVLDSVITYDLPKLDVMVPRREALVNLINHVHAHERKYGGEMKLAQLRQLGITVGMPMVDSVEDFETEVRNLNTEISTKIELIKQRYSRIDRTAGTRALCSDELSTRSVAQENTPGLPTINEVSTDLVRKDSNVSATSVANAAADFFKESVISAPANLIMAGITEGHEVVRDLGSTFLDTASNLTNVQINLDGEAKPRDAGFVIFKTLFNAQAAVQMVHHHTPHVMEVSRAPDPEDIVWKNVGLKASVRTLGQTLSAVATASLCIFWTPYSVFLTTLTNVENLKEDIPGLDVATQSLPMLESFLAQLGPLLIILSRDIILPLILSYFVTWEGLISIPRQESSLFVKLAVFLLIQHFFVIAVSDSVSSEVLRLLDNPGRIADLLGSRLPSQSSIFIQLIVMEATLVHISELLRLNPLFQAFIRPRVGRNLTEKDRKSKAFFFVHPLENPPPFYASRRLASQSLFIMTFFVYATIAPIVNFFLVFCSMIIETGYRYNFYHNYHAKPDSKGKYWEQFIRLSLVCMVIAQLALIGFLSLKRSAFAIPFMVPLLVVSLYYIRFLNMRHFDIANNLPTHKCLQTVRKNLKAIEDGELDMNFAVGKYLQPSLETPTLHPENINCAQGRGDLPGGGDLEQCTNAPGINFVPEKADVQEDENLA